MLRYPKGFEDGDILIRDFSKQVEDKQDEQPSTSKDGQKLEESEESKELEESEESEEPDKENLDWLKYATKKQFKKLKIDVNKLPDGIQVKKITKIRRLCLSKIS